MIFMVDYMDTCLIHFHGWPCDGLLGNLIHSFIIPCKYRQEVRIRLHQPLHEKKFPLNKKVFESYFYVLFLSILPSASSSLWPLFLSQCYLYIM